MNAATLTQPGAILLTRTLPNDGVLVDATNGLLFNTATGMVTGLTLTFANEVTAGLNSASLADGYWRISIPSLGYQSGLNDVSLRRLFGDAEGNGTVDATDFAAIGAGFGQSAAGSPFDFDNNGTLDAADLAAFGNRFGLTL